MIEKLEGSAYGYRIADMTGEEWEMFVKEFTKSSRIRCIICNKDMGKLFRVRLLGQNILTINNRIPDGILFLNYPY